MQGCAPPPSPPPLHPTHPPPDPPPPAAAAAGHVTAEVMQRQRAVMDSPAKLAAVIAVEPRMAAAASSRKGRLGCGGAGVGQGGRAGCTAA
jgi:hypothetical protein